LKQGAELSNVYKTLQTFIGGLFVNYFNRFGWQWQVYLQAEGIYRTDAQNLGQFFVRNNKTRRSRFLDSSILKRASERKGKVKAETPQVEGVGVSQPANTTEH
jgi:multidrug efflux pump subunit AcrB